MIDRALSFLLSKATGRRAIGSLVALFAGGGLLFRLSPYPDVRFAAGRSLPEEAVTGPSELHQFLADLSPSVRNLYLSFQGWDLINPILIGVAGVMVLGWLVGGTAKGLGHRWVLLLPLLAAGADVTENMILAIAIRSFPQPSPVAIALPVISALKFFTVSLLALAILAFLVRAVWQKFGRRPEDPAST